MSYMKSVKLPDVLKKMNTILESNGFEGFLVGGAVRDMILGKKVSDFDVATNATPNQLMKIFHKVIPTGIAHGTVTIHLCGEEIETTTYRCESEYSDGRHPDSVSFASSIDEDLSRRDFTMNAIAASLRDGSIFDPFDGISDIKKKIIRTVGNPLERFTEDGLRPIRALRFCSQLEFEIEKETFNAISNEEVRKKTASISLERFRDEFCKILLSKTPSTGLKLMEQTGILRQFIPELAETRGCTQADVRGYHEFDVLDHNFYACDGAPQNNLDVRLAALFHDIGKAKAKTTESIEWPKNSKQYTQIIHFHKHEIYSVEITRPILMRLKFSNATADKVCHLIKHHMFFFEENWTDAAVRRFICRVKPEYIDELIDLRYADIYGMHRCKVDPRSESVKKLNHLMDRVREIESQKQILSLKDLAVNGNDLIKIGIPTGRKLGFILNELFQCILDDPAMNEREKLLDVAKKINS